MLLTVSGCVTNKKNTDLWNSRIGSYTYDDAVKEYGPPDKSATLTDGTIVSEWLRRRGGTVVDPYVGVHYGYGPYWRRGYAYYPYYPYFPAGPLYPTVHSYPDLLFRLTFSPDKVLKSWNRVYK